MKRRTFLGTALGAAAGATTFASGGRALGQTYFRTNDLSRTATGVWQAWKSAYLLPDGRVVDRLQQNASHSEGQGYGLVLASEFNDAEAFQRMFDWAELHLAIRGDGLLAWRYLPDSFDPVPDRNNASDGDLFYAWGLVRAARKFTDRRYLSRATEIAQALAETCLVRSPEQPDQLVMLPAQHGFVHDGVLTVNPSYMMPLAMREVGAATGVSALSMAANHAEALMLRIADRGLVPDWIEISSSGWRPATNFSANAGYEAMRVPLFLVWSGQPRHPAVSQMMRVYDRTLQPGVPVPTVIEPVSGTVIEASNDMGYRALGALISCSARSTQVGSDMPPFDPSQPYYPATLQMFAMIAANQVSPECVPI
jgi:endo-1,4-beta-D-glucanase Y